MKEIRFLKVEKPSGRRLAISDIHGCYETFEALLQQIQLQKEDHLYLLGDVVNRGKNSHLVLDKIIELKKLDYQVFLLRGNHEQLLLNAREKSKAKLKRALQITKSENLYKEIDIRKRYVKLLSKSFHYLDLEDYYLVHAGFDFANPLPFENTQAMMHIKSFKAKKRYLNGRKIVVGHSPQPLTEIMRRVQKGKRKLYIDNGCLNKQTKGQGNLVCLNLDTLALSVQCNIET